MTITVKLTHKVPKLPHYYQELRLELKEETLDYYIGRPVDLKWQDIYGQEHQYGIFGYPKYAWKAIQNGMV